LPKLAIRLRAARSAPPGLAGPDEDRRATFSAALQQSEDLFDAAQTTGPVARPLPLFYAVSQAGRAVAAAWTRDEWRVSGHGLSQDQAANEWQGDILRFRVRPHTKPGIFGAVASAFGLPGLTSGVELGALWSALPGMTAPKGNWLRALPVWPQLYLQEGGFVLHLGAESRGYVSLRDQAPETDADAIDALLSNYPAAAGARVEIVQRIIQQRRTPWGEGVPVRWPAPSVEQTSDHSPPPDLGASYVHNRVPLYRYQQEHWLIPRVGDGRDELSALLLWWVLLFGLSLLARYEPAAWREAVDPDRSELAVPLEELLEEALTITPDLLYEAVTHELALLPPRLH